MHVEAIEFIFMHLWYIVCLFVCVRNHICITNTELYYAVDS